MKGERRKIVVLVHGIFNTGKLFRRMRRRLDAAGIESLAPSLKPRDARTGLEDPAELLKEVIAHTVGDQRRIVLVGFSMGGLVTRYYIQKLKPAVRIETLITLSAPHHGSYMSYLYPGKGARQMRPGSAFLEDLNASPLPDELSCYSFRTPYDLMILPARSSIWECAENRSYRSILHRFMVSDRRVIRDIIEIVNM